VDRLRARNGRAAAREPAIPRENVIDGGSGPGMSGQYDPA
jgi:hypothetical protein